MRVEFLISLIIIVILFPCMVWSEETLSTETTESNKTPIKISGSITNQYQGRFHGSESDNDMSQSLYLNIDGLYDGKISGALSLKFYESLDNYGTYQRNSSYYTFEGISDTYSRRIRDELYFGYFDFKDIIGPTNIRIGRQYLYQLNFVHFDGASFQWDDLGDFNIELFGGKPVSYYSSTDGKVTYGGSLDWHPWKYGSFGLAYMNYSQDSHNDDYFGLKAKQTLGPNIQLYENYTFLNSDPRDLQLQGTYILPGIGLSINATYYRQIATLQSFSDQFSAYYQAIGDYYPFDLFTIGAYQEIGNHITLNAGFTHRALLNSTYETQYNRQYNLYFGGVTFRNIVVKDLDFSVTLQRWETDAYTTSSTAVNNANPNAPDNIDPNEATVYYNVPGDKFETISAEVAYRWAKKNRIQLGTDFQKYKYNYDTNSEEQNVRTIYFKYRWQVSEDWQFYTKIEQEKQSDDTDAIYKVVTSVTYSF